MARSIVVLLTLTLTLSLSACAQMSATDAVVPPVADATSSAHCDARKVSDAVGQLPTPERQERARSDAGAQMVRVLRYNQPITKEFRVGRLNLVLNVEGRIASVNCS